MKRNNVFVIWILNETVIQQLHQACNHITSTPHAKKNRQKISQMKINHGNQLNISLNEASIL